ncbi:MAG: TetR/AcrR family transcriptional regulator [Clostridiales bacterium]|nr:TetR/AcrR family transcriptional regulator [Clostridiales bacterium]
MNQQKERDKSKKRAIILDGATTVFINMGYELASMDKIAETAKVSKRTVYNHFGSKENLFQVIIADFLAQRQELKTIKYDKEKTLEEQLLAFINAEIFLIDSPKRIGLSRSMTITFLSDLQYARETVSKYPPTFSVFLDWLKEAENDNKICATNLLLAASLFYSLIIGAITWPVLFTDGINKQAIKPMIDEIIAIFLARYGNID